MKIKILCIERKFELQTVMRAVTASGTEIESAGFFSSIDAATEGILASSPSVILMDTEAADGHSLDWIGRLRAIAPKIPIILAGKVLGMDLLLESVAAGVSGFLIMPLDARSCAAAVEEVHQGGVAFPKSALRMMMRVLQGASQTQGSGEESYATRATDHGMHAHAGGR